MNAEAAKPTFVWERAFARSMSAAREAQGLSQNEFARRLRDKDLPFHQATVQRVESQERSVRLDEAFVIAAELGLSLEQMVQDSSEFARDTMRQMFASIKVAEKTYLGSAELWREVKAVRRKSGELLDRPADNVSFSSFRRLKRIDNDLEVLSKQLETVLARARRIAELADDRHELEEDHVEHQETP